MKKLRVCIVMVIPVVFFANVWQAFRYDSVRREVLALEREQHRSLEQNKRAIAGIGALSSPARLIELAPDLELERVRRDRLIRVDITQQGAAGGR